MSPLAPKTQPEPETWFSTAWRPTMAWVCVAAFAFNYLVLPITSWSLAVFGYSTPPPPALDVSVMMPVLLGMLGLATARTYEKTVGAK